jgi:hypothetical protein
MQTTQVLAQKTGTTGLPLNESSVIARRAFRGFPEIAGAGRPRLRCSIS